MTSKAGKLELLMIEYCQEYQGWLDKLKQATERAHKANLRRTAAASRGKIRAIATALVWINDSPEGKRPHISQIQATEREYMKKAKDAPDF